ncbi:hypothetical protein GCM10010492_66690 [Saccharothrix mutabilis subsp. mutabilis]|uniref:Uncharacterized protein n=1 Tax=Saccharothrix mutabilis subsp. mutabilis TaxID=66855 RepID=A0ABN0UNR6_9PSEU
MSLIRPVDSDFRVCQITFDTLLLIQSDAEERGYATRWSSVDALRSQVKEQSVVLQSLTREERGGTLRAYRCLLLFPTAEDGHAGGVSTIDVEPTRYESLERLDRDPDVRKALTQMMTLAMGGISMTSKK